MKDMAKILCVMIMLSLIIVTTIMSTLYTMDWQLKYAEMFKKLTVENGKDFIDTVLSDRDLLEKLTDSNVLALSPRAFQLAQYLPSLWRINVYRIILRNLLYPNLFLTICSSFNASCAIIYNVADVKQINSSTILWYFLKLSKTLKVDDFKISFLPYMIPPSFKSNVCLVFRDFDSNSKFISVALSLLGINYTHTYYLDIASLRDCTWLILPSENMLYNIFDLMNTSSPSKKVIVLNLEGSYKLLRRISLNDTTIRISSNYPIQAIANSIPAFNGTAINTSSLIDAGINVIGDDPQALVILDDNFSGWRAQGIGYGRGNISVPMLTLSSRSISGATSIVIKVGRGKYYQWRIERTFKELNITEYDYLTLYWYGRGDGKEYVINLYTPSGSLRYTFIDNWLGWRKVYLPLKLPNGRYYINNVTVTKVTIKKPNLAHIMRITLGNSAHNLNLSGVFMIDRVAFEHALKLHIEYHTARRIVGIELITRTNGTVDKEVLLSTNSSKMLGSVANNTTFKILYHFNRTAVRLDLIMIRPITKMEVSIYPLGKVKLNTNRKIRNLTLVLGPNISKGHVIKYLDLEQRVPFVIYIKDNLYFVNAFPLLESYERNNISFREYIFTLSDAFTYIDVPKGNLDINIDKDFTSVYKVVLKDLRASGNITLKPLSGSIIISSYNNSISKNEGLAIVLTKDNNLLIKATSLIIIERYGYYVLLKVHNATLISKYPLRLVILREENGNVAKVVEAKNGTIYLGNAQLLLRGFKLEVDGDTDLVGVYTFKDLYTWFCLKGEKIFVHGHIDSLFRIFDKYIAGTELQINGKIERKTSVEHSYRVDLDFLMHVLIPSILVAIFATFLYKRRIVYSQYYYK